MPALEEILSTPFAEFAAVLLIAALMGGLAAMLRQPLIAAFIIVGILVGPAGLGIVAADEQIELLASLGIAILLFVVGLRLDLEIIRTMGPVALAAGLGQIVFTAVIGYLICTALGMTGVSALYVSIALTFSSTIIIVKLLSDKREIDALHGRIAVGVLIVQDIVVILMMIGLSAFAPGNGNAENSLFTQAAWVLVRGLGLLGAVWVLSRYVLPRLTHLMAKHQELLLLFAIAWASTLAAVGDAMGFSKEVGAFLAGVSLASTPFRDSISSRLVSVRDFLLLFFFVNLGATLELSQIGAHIGAAILLSLFVLIGKPVIVMAIIGAMGYRRRTGFLTGWSLGQISEFSLIVAALGVSLGHISSEALGLITLVGLITIGLSTYMILYSHPTFERLASALKIFERSVVSREVQQMSTPLQLDVILFGLGRFGSNIARQLKERGLHVLGVDFDPQVVNEWRKAGRAVQYGDAEDPEFAATLPLSRTRWVISTMPQLLINTTLLHALRGAGFTCKVALTAHNHHDARLLREAGADLALLPFEDAAVQAVDYIIEKTGANRADPTGEPAIETRGASAE
jgi:Kef-type K+ transport system membrane component KefB